MILRVRKVIVTPAKTSTTTTEETTQQQQNHTINVRVRRVVAPLQRFEGFKRFGAIIVRVELDESYS
jgi:hypothetical protein